MTLVSPLLLLLLLITRCQRRPPQRALDGGSTALERYGNMMRDGSSSLAVDFDADD